MTDPKTMPREIGKEDEPLPMLQSAKDLFDQVDTGELVKELRRRVTGVWAYEFQVDGKPVRGISAAGARESAVTIAHQTGGQLVIRVIGLEKMEEEPDCFKACVKAGTYVVGIDRKTMKPIEVLTTTSIGYATQPKWGIRKDGSKYPINHAGTQCVSKAERNAIAHQIPERVKEAILDVALNEGRVEEENGGQIPNANEPPSKPNGDEPASGKQMNYIKALLKSNAVPKEMKADCEKALKKGISKTQGSKWIELLKDTVGEKDGTLL